MALALLAAAWARANDQTILALIVDHGLRPESGDEAAWTAAKLRGRGIAARILTLSGLRKVASEARAARYAALEAGCRDAGLVDLLLAHHQLDQAETLMIRNRAGSRADGLACMPVLAERDGLRLLRPLLHISPERLRATLRHRGMEWVEDPSNHDPRAERTRARQRLKAGDARIIQQLDGLARRAGQARAVRDTAMAEELATYADIRPEGCVVLHGPLSPRALAALIRMVAGADFAPSPGQVSALAKHMRPCTLAGCRVLAGGRLGGDWLLVRESAAMEPEVAAMAGACWDRRFRLGADARLPDNARLGALGADAAGFRHLSGLPAAALCVLPAIRIPGRAVAAPVLDGSFPIRFAPPMPASGAPFWTVSCR